MHLGNFDAYLWVQNWNIDPILEEFNTLLNSYLWPKVLLNFLKTTTAELPKFYIIPKMHKEPITSRPIIPSHSWVTSRSSEVIDYFLQKCLPYYHWILDSTKSFVQALREADIDLANVYLVTGDVTAMYTNIPPLKAISICQSILRKHNIDLEGCTLEMIVKLLEFTLLNNYFCYEDCHWKQISGLAMGTACAPIVANLFCAFFEQVLLRRDPNIIFYRRYIDDIFLLYRGSEAELGKSLAKLQIYNLKITWESSYNHIHFLDVNVYRIGTRLATSVYRKWLNKYMYIPWSSSHPISVKKAFVKAERTRLRLICSEEQDYQESSRFFFVNLLRRGYPKQVLLNWFSLSLIPNNREVKKEKVLLPSLYNPVWEYINMSRLSQELLTNLARSGLNIPPSISKGLLLSLKRTRNFNDLFNMTNLTIIEQDSSLSIP